MVMQVKLPGLVRSKQRSGRYSWRVRPVGEKWRMITVPPPDHPHFADAYAAARRGEKFTPPTEPIPKSLAWLVREFEAAMETAVASGRLKPGTLKQRRAFYARICADHGDKAMMIPRHKVYEIRDGMADTPGAADNMTKALRAMYAWAIERGLAAENPAAGIRPIGEGRGAVPWSVDDLRAFRDRHPQGTMPHLALTLFMFTACRIGDAAILGRTHEVRRDGLAWLEWQPGKKGSAPVSVPILPPLARAIAAQKVAGPTYLLNGWGKSFASSAALGNWFRDRVREAGLKDRSPHGIRKACGELLALEGATQYHIMAVLGHTQAKTSEVYTQSVNRRELARSAAQLLAGMDW